MNCAYLDVIGVPLSQCLAELVTSKPPDPIEWIAYWLYRYSDQALYFYEKSIYNKDMALARLEIEREKNKRKVARQCLQKQISVAQEHILSNSTSIAGMKRLMGIKSHKTQRREIFEKQKGQAKTKLLLNAATAAQKRLEMLKPQPHHPRTSAEHKDKHRKHHKRRKPHGSNSRDSNSNESSTREESGMRSTSRSSTEQGDTEKSSISDVEEPIIVEEDVTVKPKRWQENLSTKARPQASKMPKPSKPGARSIDKHKKGMQKDATPSTSTRANLDPFDEEDDSDEFEHSDRKDAIKQKSSPLKVRQHQKTSEHHLKKTKSQHSGSTESRHKSKKKKGELTDGSQEEHAELKTHRSKKTRGELAEESDEDHTERKTHRSNKKKGEPADGSYEDIREPKRRRSKKIRGESADESDEDHTERKTQRSKKKKGEPADGSYEDVREPKRRRSKNIRGESADESDEDHTEPKTHRSKKKKGEPADGSYEDVREPKTHRSKKTRDESADESDEEYTEPKTHRSKKKKGDQADGSYDDLTEPKKHRSKKKKGEHADGSHEDLSEPKTHRSKKKKREHADGSHEDLTTPRRSRSRKMEDELDDESYEDLTERKSSKGETDSHSKRSKETTLSADLSKTDLGPRKSQKRKKKPNQYAASFNESIGSGHRSQQSHRTESTSSAEHDIFSDEETRPMARKQYMRKATWCLDCNLGLVCDHPILGQMKARCPFVLPESPEWWESQGYRAETLYDPEVYSVGF